MLKSHLESHTVGRFLADNPSLFSQRLSPGTHMRLLKNIAGSMGSDMHAAEFLYNGWTLIPLAPGTTGSYASMLIVADPFGQKRALNRLGDFPTADAACSFALACGKAIADGKDHRRLFHSDGRPKQLFTVAIAATRTR